MTAPATKGGASTSANFTAVATDRLWMDRVAKEENYQRMFAYDTLGHTATAQALVNSGSIITQSASQIPYSVYQNKHNNPENSPQAAKRRAKLGGTSSLPALSPKKLGEEDGSLSNTLNSANGLSPLSMNESPRPTTNGQSLNGTTNSRNPRNLPHLIDLVSVHPWAGSLSANSSPRRPFSERGLLDEQMGKRLASSTGRKGYGSSFVMRSVAQDSYGVRPGIELKGDVSGFRRRKYKYE